MLARMSAVHLMLVIMCHSQADLKKRERDYVLAQQEVVDLQKQVF